MKRSPVVRRALVVAFACSCALPLAHAADPVAASVKGSAASAITPSAAAGVLVGGSLATLQLTGQAVVASVETVADGSVIVLHGLSQAGDASVRVTGAVSVGVGTTVQVVAMSTGCALVAAGRTIAFIPNEVGRSLVHQSRTTALRGDR